MVMLRQMSKSRYNEIGHEYLPAPTAGIAPDIPPWVMGNEESPIIDNFLVRPGKLQLRNGMVAEYDLSANGLASIAACNPLAGGLLVTQRAANLSTGNTLEAIHLHATGQTWAILQQPTLKMQHLTGGYVNQVTAASIDLVPGPRSAQLPGNLEYALAYSNPARSIYEDGVSGPTNTLLKPQFSLTTPRILTHYAAAAGAPLCGMDVTTWLNRLWVLGGYHTANGTTAVTSRLFYTNPVSDLTAQSDWTDPSSGLINQIDVSPDSTDPAVGLATTSIGLIIFRLRSVWVMRGTDPTNFVLRRLASSVGCFDPRTITEVDNGVYFLSRQGLMWTDGVSMRNVSGSLAQTLQDLSDQWLAAAYNGDSAYFTIAPLSSGHLVVSYGTQEVQTDLETVFTTYPQFTGLFDTAAGVWTTLSTALDDHVTNQPLGLVAPYKGGVAAIANAKAITLSAWGTAQYENPNDTPPGLSITSGAGIVDYDTSVEVTESASFSFPVPITGHWRTRAAGLGSGVRNRSLLKRAYVDLRISTDDGSPVGTLTASLLREEDDATITQTVLENFGSGATANVRHVDLDCYSEVDSGLLIDLTLTGPTSPAPPGARVIPPVTAVEIHGAGVQYQVTADMRDPVN